MGVVIRREADGLAYLWAGVRLVPATATLHTSRGPIRMRPLQARVLAVLMAASGRPMTADALAEAIYCDSEEPEGAWHTMRVVVHRLRLALAGTPLAIETRPWGGSGPSLGYALTRREALAPGRTYRGSGLGVRP